MPCQRHYDGLNHAYFLTASTLPPTVHLYGPHRRFYDLDVGSEKKRLKKLASMHHNPVKRGLVDSPEKWPYSSFRFYFLEDTSMLTIDQMPESHTWQKTPCMRHPPFLFFRGLHAHFQQDNQDRRPRGSAPAP